MAKRGRGTISIVVKSLVICIKKTTEIILVEICLIYKSCFCIDIKSSTLDFIPASCIIFDHRKELCGDLMSTANRAKHDLSAKARLIIN